MGASTLAMEFKHRLAVEVQIYIFGGMSVQKTKKDLRSVIV